nr:hypothetical protein [Tanacetum cinerariifolium]
MKEAVLVWSRLSSIWSNQKCDSVFRGTNMSIYDFKTLPTWGDAKIVEEPHQFPISILEQVQNNTTVLAAELGSPPHWSHATTSDPSHIGTFVVALASTSGHSLVQKEAMRRQLDPLDTLAQSDLVHDQEYDHIPEVDFATASRGEEIDLTLFPLAPGPYVMPYPFEGDSSPERALDRTITLVKLKRTESLLPLELSNQMIVLIALLTSHDTKINSCYIALVAFKVLSREKINRIYEEKSKGLIELNTDSLSFPRSYGSWTEQSHR